MELLFRQYYWLSSSSSGATVQNKHWLLLRLLSLRPAAIVKTFSTVKAFYGVGP
jgi:hypothetical protein